MCFASWLGWASHPYCHQTLALGVLTNMVMPSSCVQSFIEHGLLLGWWKSGRWSGRGPIILVYKIVFNDVLCMMLYVYYIFNYILNVHLVTYNLVLEKMEHEQYVYTQIGPSSSCSVWIFDPNAAIGLGWCSRLIIQCDPIWTKTWTQSSQHCC